MAGQTMSMVRTENELSIRSRYGPLRDLIPIYSFYQLIPNLAVVGFLLWMDGGTGRLPPIVALGAMLGWVFQYVSRPSVMAVSQEQADWLEAVIEADGFYVRSETDGKWRLQETPWWQRWPHNFIEFVPGDSVTIVAPRDVMEALRASLELMEERGELWFAADGQPFSFEQPEPEPELPRHMQVPSVILGAACMAGAIGNLTAGGPKEGFPWGLSAAALSEGRYEAIFLHMFVHGGVMHFAMNMSVLAAIGATLTSRLGRPPLSWLRFLLLFVMSGLAGAALYLALHPAGTVPMVGASGGIYGLIGLLIRTSADNGTVLAIKSRQIRRIGWDLVKQNAFLFVLLALMSWSSGSAGGLAWEAHLGGFLVGLFVGPRLLPRTAPAASSETPASETSIPAS
jgi:membrane associated rhomboid family serine protease